MTFLAPLALGLLAALPLIYLVHLLRGRRSRQRVSSTWLWRELPVDLTSQQRRLRLAPLSLLLALQLLAAAAGALGVARFATWGQPPRHVAFVLDASASMQATDMPAQRSRFEAARARALQALADLGAGDTATLVRAGARATLLASGRPSDVRDALAQAQPGAGGAALDQALAITSTELMRTPNAEGHIVLLTDGAFPPLEPLGTLAAPVEVDSVGGSDRNQAVVGLHVRAEPSGRAQAAYVELANAESRAVRVQVELLADDLLLETRTLDLPPRGEGQLAVSLPPDAARVTARLAGRDALALDDVMEVAAPSLRPRTVVLLSQVPAALQRALGAIPSVQVKALSLSDYKGNEAADLTVLDGAFPPRLPAGPLLVVNPPRKNPILQVGDQQDAGPLIAFAAEHPLLQGVDAAALSTMLAPQIKPPPWARVVAGTVRGPLVLDGRQEGRAVVVLAPDPILSGLDKSIAFPLLVANAVGYLLDGGLGAGLAPGQVVSLPAAAGLTAVLRRPDGREQPLQVNGGELRIDQTDQVGRYQVLEQPGGRVLRSFAVNLADAAESDIRPRPDPAIPASVAPPPSRPPLEWWWPLLLAALGLLAVEWLIFARRG